MFCYFCKLLKIEKETMENIEQIRADFPALQQKVYGKDLVYFDNAATIQKPQCVLDLQREMSQGANANIHRAVHKLSGDATELYEKGREAVREFISAPEKECIIFTSGTTASINLVASTFVPTFLKKGDKVLLSEAEHHSNIVPWQIACEKVGAQIEVIPVGESGEVKLEDVERLITEEVKILSIAHISNVLGVVNPIKEIVEIAHSKGVKVLVDGAQGVVHTKVNVQELDCDFYVFSGHKIYAPTGIGVLYGKREILEALPPYMGGGDMVDRVTFAKTTYAPLPLKFEAGTPNFIAAAALAPALEYAKKLRDSKMVAFYETAEIEFFVKELLQIDGLKIYGLPKDLGKKIPLFSFTVEGVHPSDLAQILDKMGIAVRSGLMCAEPIITKFSKVGMLRVSLAPYNTIAEAKYFITSLKRAIVMLR